MIILFIADALVILAFGLMFFEVMPCWLYYGAGLIYLPARLFVCLSSAEGEKYTYFYISYHIIRRMDGHW